MDNRYESVKTLHVKYLLCQIDYRDKTLVWSWTHWSVSVWSYLLILWNSEFMIQLSLVASGLRPVFSYFIRGNTRNTCLRLRLVPSWENHLTRLEDIFVYSGNVCQPGDSRSWSYRENVNVWWRSRETQRGSGPRSALGTSQTNPSFPASSTTSPREFWWSVMNSHTKTAAPLRRTQRETCCFYDHVQLEEWTNEGIPGTNIISVCGAKCIPTLSLSVSSNHLCPNDFFI